MAALRFDLENTAPQFELFTYTLVTLRLKFEITSGDMVNEFAAFAPERSIPSITAVIKDNALFPLIAIGDAVVNNAPP